MICAKFIKWLSLGVLGLALALGVNGAESGPANGDADWAEIVTASKPLREPAEWSQKKPSAEELAEFKAKSAILAVQLADRLKAFHKAYPNHPKAMDAWMKEQALRSKASHGPSSASSTPAQAAVVAAPDFKAELATANRRIQTASAAGPLAEAAELELSARRLIRSYPGESAGWQFLLKAGQGMGNEKAAQFYAEISEKAPTPSLRADATSRLKSQNSPLGKEVKVGTNFSAPSDDGKSQAKVSQLAFTAIDGRSVSMGSLAGKVVLIDFWATWCPACIESVPEVREVYKQFHGKGFEIVGISFDGDRNDLKRFVASKKIEWPQFFDGGGWNNAINKIFGLNSIPTMYLVDKKGVLRDVSAHASLSDKVAALLTED